MVDKFGHMVVVAAFVAAPIVREEVVRLVPTMLIMNVHCIVMHIAMRVIV